MNRRRRWLKMSMAYLVLGGVLGIYQTALALPPDTEEREERMEQQLDKIESELNLTQEQKAKLQTHRKTHREQARVLRKELMDKKKALGDELEKDHFDLEQARRTHEELKSLQSRMADHRFEGIVSVRQILSAEQYQKFHDLKRQHWKEGKPGQEGRMKKMKNMKK